MLYRKYIYIKYNYNYFILGACIMSIMIGTFIYYFMKPSKEKQYKSQLEKCYKDVYKMIDKHNCYPIMLRLAWSDVITYDCMIKEWPYCGGSNGSIRYRIVKISNEYILYVYILVIHTYYTTIDTNKTESLRL